jgi:hypothetical protein
MKVETFECQETMEESMELELEAVNLIQNLKLEGQMSLIKKTESGSDVRCPYREFTKDELFVYNTLCPEKIPVERYTASPIPVRVLQVIAHAKSIEMFDRILVWDKESVQMKDPVLVGEIGNQYASDKKQFILARWGEELDEFPYLLKKAAKIHKDKILAKYREIMVKAKQDFEITESIDEVSLINTNGPYYAK